MDVTLKIPHRLSELFDAKESKAKESRERFSFQFNSSVK